MPQKLTERPEEQLRQFLTDNIRPAEVEGYDPNQTNPQATDFLPVINDWSDYGDYYPIISIREDNGPTIPGSGNTNFNGQFSDGSGPTQYTIYPVTISCQTVEEGSYLNNTSAEQLVLTLYQECHQQIQSNATTALSEPLFVGMTPPTTTRSTEETDSGSTITWIQKQGTINFGVINTP
jgi:hypothetical protein